MFKLFRKYTEEDILTKFVSPQDRVLVIGPMGEYGKDLTLPILLEKIKNKNLTIIDIKASGIGEAYAVVGDLSLTKETIKKISTGTIKYVMSDAKIQAFKGETFDIIIDRITHEFMILFAPFDKHSQEDADKLIFEYNRVLKKNGKIIFFSSKRHIQRKLINLLEVWGYNIVKGKLKGVQDLEIGGRTYRSIHVTYYYIVAIKL